MPSFPEKPVFFRGCAVAAVCMLVMHLVAGWAIAPFGAVVGGFVATRRGLIVGAVGGLASWSILVAWNWSVDPQATAEMTRVVSSLLGNLPAGMTVVLTLLLGTVLGMLGGWVGQTTRNLAWAVRR